MIPSEYFDRNCGGDVLQLRPRRAAANRRSHTPEDLEQTDDSVLAKWDDLRKAGRAWRTNVQAVPVPVG